MFLFLYPKPLTISRIFSIFAIKRKFPSPISKYHFHFLFSTLFLRLGLFWHFSTSKSQKSTLELLRPALAENSIAPIFSIQWLLSSHLSASIISTSSDLRFLLLLVFAFDFKLFQLFCRGKSRDNKIKNFDNSWAMLRSCGSFYHEGKRTKGPLAHSQKKS